MNLKKEGYALPFSHIKNKSTKYHKQMFLFLLTCEDRYDIMQEYRCKSCLYFFAVHWIQVWRSSLAEGRAHNEIAPRSCMLRSCRAERMRGGNQPEPSRRTGLPKSIEELFGKRKHNEAKLAAVLAPLHDKRSLCWRGPKWGFISIRFFRNRASFKVSFSLGEDGVILCYCFFKARRLPLNPKKMRDERLL